MTTLAYILFLTNLQYLMVSLDPSATGCSGMVATGSATALAVTSTTTAALVADALIALIAFSFGVDATSIALLMVFVVLARSLPVKSCANSCWIYVVRSSTLTSGSLYADLDAHDLDVVMPMVAMSRGD